VPCRVPDVWTPLPADWSAFERQLGTSAMRQIRRAERYILDAYPDAAWQLCTTPDACRDAVAQLIRLYRQHWGGGGLGCCFNDPRRAAFYQRAVVWAAQQGMGMVSLLRLRGVPVALETLFRTSRRSPLYMHYCARDLSLPNRFSPGLMEAAHAFRWAVSDGVPRVNQGPLMMPYKQLFGGVATPRWEVALARTAASLALLPALDRGLHLAQRLPVHLQYHLTRHRFRPAVSDLEAASTAMPVSDATTAR